MNPDQSSRHGQQQLAVRHAASSSERASNPLFDGIVSAVAQLCELPIGWLAIGGQDASICLSSVGLNLKEQLDDAVIWRMARAEPTGLIQHADKDLTLLKLVTSEPPSNQMNGLLVCQLLLGTHGQAIGLLCLYGIQPTQLTEEQVNSLVRLGGLAAFLIQYRQADVTGKLYSLLEKSVPCAIVVTDPCLPDQPITFCNDEFCRLTGYDRAEILGRNCRFLQGEGTDPMVTAKLERDLALGSIQSLLLKNYRKDGTEFWNDLSISIDRDSEGGVRQFVWAAHDATDRVRAERNVAFRNDPFEHLAEEAYIFSAETGRFLLVNKAARKSLGYSSEEVLSLSAEDINPNLSAKDSKRLVRPIREGLVDVLVRRTLFQRKDGSTYPVESKLRISYFDRTEAILCYAIDISELQTIERIVRENCRNRTPTNQVVETAIPRGSSSLFEALTIARQASRSKSDFLSAASHDLRQPLHAIGLGLDRLQNANGISEVREITPLIRSSVNVMTDLLNALLDIGRFETGSVQVSKCAFDLDPMLMRIVEAHSIWAIDKGLSISYENRSLSVYSDQALLERVIDNFVANAIRFTNSGRVTIRASADKTNVRITVSDTGIGIPTKSFQRIFEQHHQLFAQPGSRSEGLGLGLTVAHRIATLLKHPIVVASETGTGSDFSVDVPLSNEEELMVQETVAIAEPKGVIGPSARVLLAEDDRLIALTTTTLLEAKGYEVFSVSTAQEAVSGIQIGFRPAIIVTDYRLIASNGIDLIHQVRQAMNSEIPALMITGDTNSDEVRRALPASCCVLYKPVDFEMLNTRILKMLAGEQV